jgi:hypothetical protein
MLIYDIVELRACVMCFQDVLPADLTFDDWLTIGTPLRCQACDEQLGMRVCTVCHIDKLRKDYTPEQWATRTARCKVCADAVPDATKTENGGLRNN